MLIENYLEAVGINAGAYVHLVAAVIGLSVVLAASSLAFLPQFVNPGSKVQTTAQLLTLGISLNVIALAINLLLVQFSSIATAKLRKSPYATIWLNRAMGTVFIYLGIRLAHEKI